MARILISLGLAVSAAACSGADNTVVEDANMSLYTARVDCRPVPPGPDFEGIALFMVPGPDLLDLPGQNRGCVELLLTPQLQGVADLDVSLDEGFFLQGGALREILDCSLEAQSNEAAPSRALVSASGTGDFVDGPDGTLNLEADLMFEGATTLVANVRDLNVRRGLCEPDFL